MYTPFIRFLKAFFTGFLANHFYRIHQWIDAQLVIANTQRALDSVNGPVEPPGLTPMIMNLYLPLILIIAFLTIVFFLWRKELMAAHKFIKEKL